VEASGYHLPLVAPGALPSAWEAVEFNPAHVAEQRKTIPRPDRLSALVMVTRVGRLVVADFSDPDQLARVLPDTPYAVLTTTPGWTTIRAAGYGDALGDRRWRRCACTSVRRLSCVVTEHATAAARPTGRPLRAPWCRRRHWLR
jgi:hypothetical protein